jgi:type I site-specific restriction endonuclease
MDNIESLTDLFGDPISIYTRAQAIADGVLVDVSDRAKRFAIRFPVAVTDGLYTALTEHAATEPLKQLCVDLLLITTRQQITAASETDRIDFSVKLPHVPAIAV